MQLWILEILKKIRDCCWGFVAIDGNPISSKKDFSEIENWCLTSLASSGCWVHDLVHFLVGSPSEPSFVMPRSCSSGLKELKVRVDEACSSIWVKVWERIFNCYSLRGRTCQALR